MISDHSYDPSLFAEKYFLALEQAVKDNPDGGVSGCELEWNMLDASFRPLLTVGSGPSQKSFVDYLREECLSPYMRAFSQLEVFNWMIEWATRPYYSTRGAIQEGRMMEAVLINALNQAGNHFSDQLFHWHGNLIYPLNVGFNCIPDSWHIAKRRYLERCVSLYGNNLATAGTHSNLSLPDPLFAWDFMHLPASQRNHLHLDEYKSEFYITASRLMRAFAALFIATSASTPFLAHIRDDEAVMVLTEADSQRNLTFPNPPEIDLPDLYRSYADYLSISYDLVRRGVRFGNNNWTPVRARSHAEPVERMILVTSDQLRSLYSRGLYAQGSVLSVDDMAKQIEQQNLLARINLPMARVEVRTDDGGNPMDVEVANLTLKHLLMMRFYADPQFARAFRYDAEDLQRARRNEELASRSGLRSEVEHPLSAKPISMRKFLSWTLDELQPLAQAVGVWDELQPLVEMSRDGLNTAEKFRQALAGHLENGDQVPVEWFKEQQARRVAEVSQEVEHIAEVYDSQPLDSEKIGEFVQRARQEVRRSPEAPIRFRPKSAVETGVSFRDTTSEIVSLSSHLIRIPSVTACPNERLDEVRRASLFIFDYARRQGLGVRYYDQEKYPALLIGFPGQMLAPVMLSGHFDVVEPEPDDGQFEPRLDGDYLWGRGAADMKTVVATYLVWMKDALHTGPPYPPVNCLLVGNEENGEGEPMGTPHVLRLLAEENRVDQPGGAENPYAPQLLIAGERTGEKGDEMWGEICTENRGVMRFDVRLRGQRGHSGVAASKAGQDLTERLLHARSGLIDIFSRRLTLNSPDGWQSQAKFPFIQVGTPGVYNITADQGLLGVEVRPIPQDDITGLHQELDEFCRTNELELIWSADEPGIICDEDNLYLGALIQAVEQASKQPARLSRKLPGTSARFAPRGQGVVWGQTGIGPHAKGERHYIPSILPYYNALQALAKNLVQP